MLRLLILCWVRSCMLGPRDDLVRPCFAPESSPALCYSLHFYFASRAIAVRVATVWLVVQIASVVHL